jgi:hypothetical protein
VRLPVQLAADVRPLYRDAAAEADSTRGESRILRGEGRAAPQRRRTTRRRPSPLNLVLDEALFTVAKSSRPSLRAHEIEVAVRTGLNVGNDAKIGAEEDLFAFRDEVIEGEVVSHPVPEARIVELEPVAAAGQAKQIRVARVGGASDRGPDDEIAVVRPRPAPMMNPGRPAARPASS